MAMNFTPTPCGSIGLGDSVLIRSGVASFTLRTVVDIDRIERDDALRLRFGFDDGMYVYKDAMEILMTSPKGAA
jgi:hypothetical protein